MPHMHRLGTLAPWAGLGVGVAFHALPAPLGNPHPAVMEASLASRLLSHAHGPSLVCWIHVGVEFGVHFSPVIFPLLPNAQANTYIHPVKLKYLLLSLFQAFSCFQCFIFLSRCL